VLVQLITMSRVYALFKVGRPFDESNRFQTSWVLSPCVLAAARLSFALYLFSTQVFTLSHDSVHDPIAVRQHWSYFTNISLWSLGFYFLFAGCNGVVYAVSGVAPLQKWPRPFQAAYGIFYSTITVYPILVYVYDKLPRWDNVYFSNLARHSGLWYIGLFLHQLMNLSRAHLKPGLQYVFSRISPHQSQGTHKDFELTDFSWFA
jgi:hypothetical protein